MATDPIDLYSPEALFRFKQFLGESRALESWIENLIQDNRKLREWVNDLQSGMYINCVYCGHRYGPDDEVASTMAEALYEHIKNCAKHPLAQANREIDKLTEEKGHLYEEIDDLSDECFRLKEELKRVQR